MDKTDWLTKMIKEHKEHCKVIPIKNELLGFCNGDYPTVALFTQLLYWQDKTRISGGWIAKSAKDWSEELYLSQRQVSRITKKLGSLKLIETKLKKFDGSPTTHYRLRETEFKRAFVKYLKTGTSILTKGENPIGQNGEIDFGEKDKSILTNSRNSIRQNGEIDFGERDKSILTNSRNSIRQNGKIDFDKRCKSLTENTTEPTTKLTPEKKAESDFSSFEITDFNDSEISKITSDVAPKEKSCGKKEKVTVQLPFESESFEQVWNGWQSYLLEKFNRKYSELEEQAALMPLQNYDEAFAKELITKAISSGWKAFHFPNTSNDFQKFLIKKKKNYDTANEVDFRKATDERGDDLWNSFNA
jgi:hypothetical protein